MLLPVHSNCHIQIHVACLSNNYKMQDIFVALNPHKNEDNDSSHLAHKTKHFNALLDKII